MRGEAEPSTLLIQAQDRARRLYELLQSHEADLLRHVQLAEKSASRNVPATPPLTQPDPAVLRDGADRIRRAADDARRLLANLTRALGDEEGR